jgi:hypothetical protein
MFYFETSTRMKKNFLQKHKNKIHDYKYFEYVLF